MYSAADGHRTKAPWTRFHTTAVRFFLSSLVHNCYTSNWPRDEIRTFLYRGGGGGGNSGRNSHIFFYRGMQPVRPRSFRHVRLSTVRRPSNRDMKQKQERLSVFTSAQRNTRNPSRRLTGQLTRWRTTVPWLWVRLRRNLERSLAGR
jgi:hypothetical protein